MLASIGRSLKVNRLATAAAPAMSAGISTSGNILAKADSLIEVANGIIAEAKEAGTYKSERVITSPQASHIEVAGKTVLNFCANNYLGLANDPEIVAAAKNAMDTHGFGMASVRFICGTQDIHKDLEAKISDFHRMEDTILYPSCFDANAGLFEAVLTAEDAIISDSLNHASIIDGVRLCKAQRHRYNHMDMAHLEEILQSTQDARVRMIATDGVFSMDGHIAPLDEICDLADKYNAVVFVDECHATGFFGPTGRGTPEHFGVEDRVDIVNSTLGKALGGGTGGYTTANKEVIDVLRNKARPYLFSNSITPSVAAASIAVYDKLSASTALRDQLEKNTAYFREAMTSAGFDIVPGSHPICPVMLGDARLATLMADDLLKEGIYVIGFSYPVVPKGKARIRVQLSAEHTQEQLEHAVAAFTKVGKAHGVI